MKGCLGSSDRTVGVKLGEAITLPQEKQNILASQILAGLLNGNKLSCSWKLLLCRHEVLSGIKALIGCPLVAIRTLKVWPGSQFVPTLFAQ